MAHILVTNWTPQNKVREMIKVYMSKDKPTYPDFIKKIHHWTTISPEGRKQLGKDMLYILQ